MLKIEPNVLMTIFLVEREMQTRTCDEVVASIVYMYNKVIEKTKACR
jgi:hypothetical protein